jgi:hypothetical protein
MSEPTTHTISRRRLLAGAGATAGGALAAGALAVPAASAARPAHSARLRRQAGKIDAKAIAKIIGAEGTVTDGVLGFDVSRDDIGTVKGPAGVEFDGAFEIDGMLYFQPLGSSQAFFNGCLAIKETEVQGVIDAMLANGLTFQALHQHFIGMKPQIWFMHWRGVGQETALARAVHNVLRATAIKLPQTMPKSPKSALDAKRLAKILDGEAMIGDEGVVTVDVSRKGRIVIDGVVVSPQANISTNVSFKPLNKAGTLASAAPDFSMTAGEINPVMTVMRRQGWFVGCLYNQETGESPQLYFSHMVKTGDPYALAAEIRLGLDKTRAG